MTPVFLPDPVGILTVVLPAVTVCPLSFLPVTVTVIDLDDPH
jgi:hypothetical protein